MSSTLSVYLSNHHDFQSTWDYIRALQPAWVRIHQPTARTVYMVQQAAPNAKIMLRSWDIDDHNGDRKRELYADPKGAAHQHLAMWNAKWSEIITELQRNGWAYNLDRWYIGLVNEPDPAHTQQVVDYSLEAMRITDKRLGLVWSSVGTFSKPSENDHGWARFKPLEKPINDGGHVLGVHEYWQPEGPTFGEDAGNLAWRHRHIPLNAPILIGEAGANGYIYGRHSQEDNAGWRKFMQPDQYAAQVKQYIEGCDQRVQGVCLYMTDYHSDQWKAFDTTPAHAHLLAIKDARPQVPNPFASSPRPVATHIPAVGTGSPSATPVPPLTTGIIDPTVAQAILRVESGGRTHGDNGKPLIRFEAHIFRTYLGNDALWAQHFRTDANRPWVDQMWRQSPADPWRVIHTGKQADEYSVFEFAASLHAEAAHKAISVGAAQIMGFNHARIGYASAQAMYSGFQSAPMQTLGFINFCLSDRELMAAIARRDWREIAKRYNGPGNVDTYAKLLQQAYEASA